MPKLADRVVETTTSVGLGAIALGGAKSGYRTFGSAFSVTDQVYYAIVGTLEWEVGVGTLGAGTLARTAVLSSSNSGALVSFSAGAKDVFCTAPAALVASLLAAPLLTVASSGSAFSQVAQHGSLLDITLTAPSCTLAFNSIPTGAWSVRLVLRQDLAGGRGVSWPSDTTWDSTAAPTLRTAAGEYDVIELLTVDQGVTWIGRNLRPKPAGLPSAYAITQVQNDGTTTQTLPAAVSTKIAAALASVVANSDGWWSVASKRFQPTVAGKFLVMAGCQVGNATVSVSAQIWKNGVPYVNGAQAGAIAYSSAVNSCIVELNGSTDYVEFYMFSSGAVTTNPVAANTYFKAMYLSA